MPSVCGWICCGLSSHALSQVKFLWATCTLERRRVRTIIRFCTSIHQLYTSIHNLAFLKCFRQFRPLLFHFSKYFGSRSKIMYGTGKIWPIINSLSHTDCRIKNQIDPANFPYRAYNCADASLLRLHVWYHSLCTELQQGVHYKHWKSYNRFLWEQVTATGMDWLDNICWVCIPFV